MSAGTGSTAKERRGKDRSPRTNAELTASTVGALTRQARLEFGSHGYADASIERICAEAGLTKGALYYHFGNKRSLFEAVIRDVERDIVERDIVERIEARAGPIADPFEAVLAGCEAFLDVALDDEFRQIALVDGPVVLGWSQWRAIDDEFGVGSLIEGLRACQAAGYLDGADAADIVMVAHLISGALNEAVFVVAESEDRDSAHGRATAALARLIRGAVV